MVNIAYVRSTRNVLFETLSKKLMENITPIINPFCMADFIMFGFIEFVSDYKLQKYKKSPTLKSPNYNIGNVYFDNEQV